MTTNRLRIPDPFKAVGMAALCLAFHTACTDDETTTAIQPEPPAIPQLLDIPEGGFTTTRCNVLRIRTIQPAAVLENVSWSVADSLWSTTDSLDFIALNPGTYPATLQARLPESERDTTVRFDIVVTTEPNPHYTPYVTAVTDFLPAPGQFVNELPKYEEGDTQQKMNDKALEAIGHDTRGIVSLGGFGGYIVVGFDHTIINVPGKRDFKVLGNAFYADANPDPAAAKGGSCEPGIVMVAYDRNRNGQPDEDEWYELAGSEYNKSTTIKDYVISYTRPGNGHQPVPGPADSPWMTDAEYIGYRDSEGEEGFLVKNMYHTQDYYPQWVKAGELTFTGTRLAPNAVDESGNGTYWVLYALPWGYADNAPNTSDDASFDIAWAVDKESHPVNLPGIDFVKIYTGIHQQCGWLGETSTEVSGVTDLHLLSGTE